MPLAWGKLHRPCHCHANPTIDAALFLPSREATLGGDTALGVNPNALGMARYALTMEEHRLRSAYLRRCSQGVSRIELAEYLGMSARLLLPMEKNGVVERVQNPRDARQSLVRLSKTGESLCTDTSVSFAHIAEDLTSVLSESQLGKAVELLTKLG